MNDEIDQNQNEYFDALIQIQKAVEDIQQNFNNNMNWMDQSTIQNNTKLEDLLMTQNDSVEHQCENVNVNIMEQFEIKKNEWNNKVKHYQEQIVNIIG